MTLEPLSPPARGGGQVSNAILQSSLCAVLASMSGYVAQLAAYVVL